MNTWGLHIRQGFFGQMVSVLKTLELGVFSMQQCAWHSRLHCTSSDSPVASSASADSGRSRMLKLTEAHKGVAEWLVCVSVSSGCLARALCNHNLLEHYVSGCSGIRSVFLHALIFLGMRVKARSSCFSFLPCFWSGTS